MIKTDPGSVARAYIEAVSSRDLGALETLLDGRLVAAFFGTTLDKREWIRAIGRLLPVLNRNDIREVFAAGERACIVYDFVTDTPAGAVPCVELVTVAEGRITEVELLLDRVSFAPVNAVLQDLAAQD
jgi:hypothetical protein